MVLGLPQAHQHTLIAATNCSQFRAQWTQDAFIEEESRRIYEGLWLRWQDVIQRTTELRNGGRILFFTPLPDCPDYCSRCAFLPERVSIVLAGFEYIDKPVEPLLLLLAQADELETELQVAAPSHFGDIDLQEVVLLRESEAQCQQRRWARRLLAQDRTAFLGEIGDEAAARRVLP